VQDSPNVGSLDGVAATSATNAWAVGYTAAFRSVLHWNGKVWKVQNSPSVGPLFGVAATSATNAWAVGRSILHWNGKAWNVQNSPTVGELSGVAAISPSDAWAVGYNDYACAGAERSPARPEASADSPGSTHFSCYVSRTLVEHWNGKAWSVESSPSMGGSQCSSALAGVAAISPSDAWAVGDSCGGTLVEHWNGKAWEVQKIPNLGDNFVLHGVAAISPTDAWAVGDAGSPYAYTNGNPYGGIVHWNGKVWKVQKSPDLYGTNLIGVAAISRSDVWAVGYYGNSLSRTLVEHWNGKAWKVQNSPHPGGGNNDLIGVAATSPSDVWAVGFDRDGSRTLIEHRG
jgi:hypothetical protein